MNYASPGLKGRLVICILSLIISTVCCASEPAVKQQVEASSDRLTVEAATEQPFRYRLTNRMKVDGFKLSPSLYLGQARLDNGRQWALLLDTGNIVYAVNENHVSVSFRF